MTRRWRKMFEPVALAFVGIEMPVRINDYCQPRHHYLLKMLTFVTAGIRVLKMRL